MLNGSEVGGGSVRLHDSRLQRFVLEHVLRLAHTDQLHYLLTALDSGERRARVLECQCVRAGAPPHAGFALGLDRYVALVLGAASIRDVIAFPKLSDGRCVMSSAPTLPNDTDLRRYAMHFDVVVTDTQMNS